MSKTVLALRHVHFEDLGTFESPLRAAGYSIRYCEMGVEDPRAAGEFDLLAVLGGPIGAYEEDLYPFLSQELQLIGTQLSGGRAVLGVCLGAQLIAKSLGARVYPGRGKEIGWKEVRLTDAGRDVLGAIGGLPVLHWHGDTFDLPVGASLLGSTDLCDHQAFTYGRQALALQFHLEAQPVGFERWLIGHAGEIAATRGVSVSELREQAHRHAAATAAAGQKVIAQWLQQLPART